MPTQLTAYRIFIASPGGLMEVRQRFRQVIEKYNTEDAIRRGVLFIPVGWELTLGGLGRPQSLINREIEECDAFFLILHDRWGSNPGSVEGYTSGTEEEYHKALEHVADPQRPMREISVFFKSVGAERLSDPGVQLNAVLDFKKTLEAEKKLLFQQFDEISEFETALRMLLASWVRRHEDETEQGIDAANAEVFDISKLAISGFSGVEGAPEAPKLAAESPDDPPPEAGSPLAQAAELATQGRYTEAETLYAQLTAANNDPAAAFEYGEFLFRLGRKLQAEEYLRRAAQIADISGDQTWMARAYAALGRLLASRGEFEKGAAALSEASDLYVQTGARAEYAAARVYLGDILVHEQQLEPARQAYEEALGVLEEQYDATLAADIFASMGQLNQEVGDLDAAKRNYEKAIEAKKQVGSAGGLADIFAGFGAVLESMEDLQGAKVAYQESLGLFESENKSAGIADISDHLGHVYLKLGQVPEAEAAFDRSAGVFETVQNFDGAVDAYTSLGKIQSHSGKTEEAAASFRQALALVGRIKNKEEVAEIYENLENLIKPSAV